MLLSKEHMTPTIYRHRRAVKIMIMVFATWLMVLSLQKHPQVLHARLKVLHLKTSQLKRISARRSTVLRIEATSVFSQNASRAT